MASAKRTGRAIGVLLLVHLVVGLFAPFFMLDRIRRPAGLLAAAAQHPDQVRAAVLLLFAGSAIAVVITVLGWAVFQRYGPALAPWLVALAAAAFSLQSVDNAALLSVLSVSQEHAQAGVGNPELWQAVGGVVVSARRWVHYTALLVAVSWMFSLYLLLYRSRLVPRVLAALGLVTTLLQIGSVSLRGILGYPPETRLAVPLAPVYLALAVWLMVKGFEERQRPAAEATVE